MSQGQQPTGFGKCNACKQLQPYTSQVCNICQSRLPWAVQVPPVMPTVPVPPTIPVRPQVPPGFEPSNPWQVVRTVTSMIVGGVVLIGVASFIFLTTTGNSLKNTFDDAALDNQAGVPNQAFVSNQPSAVGCGALSAVECDWQKGFNVAIQIIDFAELRGETDEQYLDRLSRQAFQVRANLRSLPTPPPRYNEVFSLTMRAMDEWDKANQLLKSALSTGSREQVRQSSDMYDATAGTLREAADRIRLISSTPP